MLNAKLQITLSEQFSLDLSLDLTEPGLYALFGPSGSGKTTTLRALAGLESSVTGHIKLHGNVLQQNTQQVPPQHRAIGFVSQHEDLLPHLTVRENLLFADKLNHNGKKDHPSIESLIKLMRLEARADARPAQLSRGEQQRTSIARSLLKKPSLLLLDEPFANIDQASRQIIFQYLNGLIKTWGLIIVFVSHDFTDVLSFSDHLLLIEGGRLVGDGSLTHSLGNLHSPLHSGPLSASILLAEKIEFDPKYHLNTGHIGKQRIYFSSASELNTDTCRLLAYARDISISLEIPVKSSILNILTCSIDEIAEHNHYALVKLTLEGHTLISKITTRSLHELNLQPGMQVFAQIKSVAILSA